MSSLERRRRADEKQRDLLGPGPGELIASFGYRMDWGPAMSKLRAWCQRFEQMGALQVFEQVERVEHLTSNRASEHLAFALEYAAQQADATVPRDTGYLASTFQADIRPFLTSSGQRGGALAVGRYSASYAALVHEEPAMVRKSGQRKWLETAFTAGFAEFTRSLRMTQQLMQVEPVLVSYDSVHGRLRVVPGSTTVGRDPSGRFRSLRGATPNFE